MLFLRSQTAVTLFWLTAAVVVAHGDEHMDMGDMDHTLTTNITDSPHVPDLYDEPSYAGLEIKSTLMVAHIGFMVLAWFFTLPIGVMFSVARSKLALPVQLGFLVLNGLGVVCSTIYNISTPDLYPNNAHHKIGWIATWVVTAQVIMSLLFLYSGRRVPEVVKENEQTSFLPRSLHDANQPSNMHRWSGDTYDGTETFSAATSSRTLSPTRDYEYTKPEVEEPEDMEDIPLESAQRRPSWFKNTRLDEYLSKSVPKLASKRLVSVVEMAYEMIDRTILILGFIALTTGIVTYTGIFRGDNVFNGLAHWIKGGIFFWYGLLTLGRWLGSFADLGWAWNFKPSRSEVGWKSRMPSAEFTESFVIFLYGCINVFLEHLAAWGGAWTAQDLEHVSISVMFFGGGLAGMLVESRTLRTWLNTSIDVMPFRRGLSIEDVKEPREEPQTYRTSLNIMPALVIFLLGIMMSSHHQDSMVSTMVHKQWGTLLSGFAIFRGLTYILNYISPPKSVYPSRPPTELAASFCLIAGGLVFMMSNKDVIHYMEVYNLMAMFTLTVTVGFTAFLMAYTMFVVGLKGWAVRREQKFLTRRPF